MRLAIVENPGDLSAYVVEIFKTWGLPILETVRPEAVAGLKISEVPVLLCPCVPDGGARSVGLVNYAEEGGCLLCFAPEGPLAVAAGLEELSDKPGPLRLRISGMPAAGLAGELLPVVGPARNYRVRGKDARVLAYLVHPGQYAGESPGVVERAVGGGRIVSFAFDLPRCVLLLRQGDPARAEVVPPGAPPHLGTWPSVVHLASDIGPPNCGWIPFADILARLLVDAARRAFPAPLPMLRHLPADFPSVLLYSGDEDTAKVEWNEREFDEVAGAGGRMNLYVIPEETHSSPADAARYLARHDLGPHPNLRPLDGRPAVERVAEYERQVGVFRERYGVTPKTVRNHCLAWVGYTDLAEAQERLGIHMDANYLAGGGFLRHREFGPYTDFGAAMPTRFCRPDGRLINVFQQHFHVEDDAWFSDWIEYSAKLSPEQYGPIIERCLDDAVARFHMPFGVNFHPTNWVDFSGEQGRATLRAAAVRGVPAWSFDQWCDFWVARDTWRFEDLSWDGTTLRFTARGDVAHPDLRVMVPSRFGTSSLAELKLNTIPVPLHAATQDGAIWNITSLHEHEAPVRVAAIYA